MRMAPWITVFAVLCSSFVALTQAAQPLARLSAGDRATAMQAIEAKLQELYVFPDMRPKIIARLEQGQQGGRYDVDDPYLFAERITADIRDAGSDQHLWMRVDPEAYAAAIAPQKGPDGEEAFERRRAIRDHHGLAEAKILPGNIRYLKITEFQWVPDETGAVYDAAMRFLKEGDALIIDIRGVPGGSHPAVQYLVSHFLDAGTLEYTFLEGGRAATQSRALDYLPAGRLKGKPLYVLIDGRTGSAAEAFAYDIQQFKLGELVGAKTGGAANNNRLLPVPPCYTLSISYGRPVHALSNTNWDGVGVEPNVAAAPGTALETAQALALKRLAQAPGVSPPAQAEYAWASVAVEARLHPVAFELTRLKTLVGHYGKANAGYGQVDVDFHEGALWFHQPNRPPSRLAPLTAEGLFAIEGNERLRARITGKVLELWWWDDPAPRLFARN